MSEASERSRAVWSAGNWDAVSELLPPAGERMLDIAGVEAGMDVLDVGCGSGGTVAIPAAQRGANVTGADVAPEHFDHARRRAAAAGVEVEWVEADAADMPLEDASFDRVLSTFGHAFAPDQEGAARELVRLCRPGGKIVAAMWTPEGVNGQMFKVTGSHMPPQPGFQPPVLWGTEARWEELVGSQGVELEFRRELLPIDWPADRGDFMDFFADNFGPLVMARRALGDEAFAALRTDIDALYENYNTATAEDDWHVEAEYLVAIGSKPA